MALFAALSRFAPALNDIRHRELRPSVQTVMNVAPEASAAKMSYDLCRLRLKGLTPAHDAGAWVARLEGRHTYVLTIAAGAVWRT
jgi:hypothetical protein